MSMFKTLAAFADISPVVVTIFPVDENEIRVFITQKREAKDSRKTLDINVTGTPDELDTQLALAIAESFAAPIKTIAAQVAAQSKIKDKTNSSTGADDEAIMPETPRKSKAAKIVKKSTLAIPKPMASERVKAKMPVKARASKSLPKKNAPPDNSDKREQCLAELVALMAMHGPRITRREYAKFAKTGRSFERIFGTWEAFLKVALEISPPPNGDDLTLPLDLRSLDSAITISQPADTAAINDAPACPVTVETTPIAQPLISPMPIESSEILDDTRNAATATAAVAPSPLPASIPVTQGITSYAARPVFPHTT